MREIACDESGYEGEKLIGSTTRLFAHASVRVRDPAGVLAELRDRIKSPATQYKATHLLRPQHRATLRWFLGPDGPVAGYGHVFLLDKAAFVRSAAAEHLGVGIRDDQLEMANAALRIRYSDISEIFYADRVRFFRQWLSEDPIGRSVLDPLVPAIIAAVDHWGPVTIAHDRQTQLPPRRIEVIRSRCALEGIRFVDAESHPEIQIADMLAGTVRWITEDGDPSLLGLLAPYLEA